MVAEIGDAVSPLVGTGNAESIEVLPMLPLVKTQSAADVKLAPDCDV